MTYGRGFRHALSCANDAGRWMMSHVFTMRWRPNVAIDSHSVEYPFLLIEAAGLPELSRVAGPRHPEEGARRTLADNPGCMGTLPRGAGFTTTTRLDAAGRDIFTARRTASGNDVFRGRLTQGQSRLKNPTYLDRSPPCAAVRFC